MPEARHRRKSRSKSLVDGASITEIVDGFSSSHIIPNTITTISSTLPNLDDEFRSPSANNSSSQFSLKKILSFPLFKTKRLSTAHPQSTHPQSTHPQSTHPQSTHSQSTHPQSTHPQSTHPQSTQPQSTHPQSTQPHSKRSSSVQFRENRTSSPERCLSRDDIHPNLIRSRNQKTKLFPCKSTSKIHSSHSTSSCVSSVPSSDSSCSSSSGYSSSSSSTRVKNQIPPPLSLPLRANHERSSPIGSHRRKYINATKGSTLTNALVKSNPRMASASNEISEAISEDGILSEDDLTCPICLDILYRPRQLVCKHSFCLLCLQNYANTCWKRFNCPSCRQYSQIPSNGVKGFMRNPLIEKSAEKLRSTRQEKGAECLNCLSRDDVLPCGHCGKMYCTACSSLHVLEVQKELEVLRNKLVEIKGELVNKKEEEECRLSRLEKSIMEAVEERIAFITQQGEQLAKKVQEMRNVCEEKSIGISEEIENALAKADTQQDSQSLDDVSKLHIRLSQLINTISKSYRIPKLSVDFSSLNLSRLSQEKTKAKEKEDSDVQPQNEDLHIIPRDKIQLYRTKSSFSRRRWGPICERPAGVAVSPWSGNLYVTGSDACKVFIFEPSGKQVASFGSRGQADGHFLCPAGLAFSQIQNELFITDKWKHCIHVFDSSGCFVRQIGYKGKGFGQFSSPEGVATDNKGNIYVADTCNNRVQVLDNDGLFLREMGVIASEELGPSGKLYTKREFNEPAAVATSLDGSMVYVADSANHRIRVFDGNSGHRLHVIGGRGSNKGQLESPEAVAVDERGFILVGDSGNGRMQVFHPNGHFVRCLGSKYDSKGEFGWVSGIAITKDGEIVVTDFQNGDMAVF